MTGWDARGYDERFGFVTELGASVLDLLSARPGERVLDLGCGTGHHAAALAGAGCTVVGTDRDAGMLDRARAEYAGLPGLAFVAADAQDPAAADLLGVNGRFDAVVSNAALHWMTDQAAALRTVRRCLVDGGRFVAEMGGAGNVAATRAAIAAGLVDVGVARGEAEAAVSAHSWFPTVAQQARLLEDAGFAVRRMELVDRPTPLAPGDSVWDWARMFRPWIVDLVPAAHRDELAARVDAHAAAAGLRREDGAWWADYVRLRFTAEAGSPPA